MSKKVWKFHLDSTAHIVELDHRYFSGKREILVDGKKLELPKAEAKQFFDRGSHHDFKIGKHICTVLIATNGITSSYDLLIDRVSQKTGKRITRNLSSLKYQAYLFNKIDNEEIALDILKMSCIYFVSIAVISAIAMSLFLGKFTTWIDVVILTLLALWLFNKKSLIAASLLLIYQALSTVVTFMNSASHRGGSNIYLAIIALAFAIRAFQSAYWFQKHRK